ncbi:MULTISPECIES: alpha/beta hydrolase [Pseudofrankia]|uniref:alpha/beta hydrolase n=1 Tax=Pseudofrankia TaxID=2994363 RepID=UPI000234B12D|nr:MULTISPECIES: alpha/beta fold hydrolase [Pseudofrankia]OHV28976.1 alpha/beta hydrolase [Pseudofrankia sp. EUN1h]
MKEPAIATTAVPVVFIHGLWLHAASWRPWADRFAVHGYAPAMPGWPGEPDTVDAARSDPRAVAGLGIDDVATHYAAIVRDLPVAPVLIGHSFGGLIAQKLLGLGLGLAAVAIAPAPIKGVRPLPFAQLRSALPALANPANRRRSVSLTATQFRYGFGNAVSSTESDELFGLWAIPSPGRPLFEAAVANLRRASPAAVDTGNASRGPLLLISGQEDRTVPDVVTRAAYKLYGDSSAITDLKQFPGRGHSLVIDSGWRQVADYTLEWLARQPLTAGR